MFENEEWREVEDLPHYLISNFGRVRKDGAEFARKLSIGIGGFPVVTMYGADGRTRKLRQVNKLVADAFVPKTSDVADNSVWHIDGDLLNCRADNLRWDMRSRVLEWNEMHRNPTPRYKTPQVRNNRTGIIYSNAFECAFAEGRLESDIVWRVERQARHTEDDDARYRYIFKSDPLYRNDL